MRAFGWAAFAAAALVLSATLPLSRAPWGQDGPIHSGNVALVAEALRAGEWAPRWVPEVHGGLGGPNFRYYASAAYAPAALCALGGLSIVEALRAACRWYFFVGFVGAGCLGARVFGLGASLLAAVLFSFSPYALVLLGTRLALPEYAALSVAPWAFWALATWARGGGGRLAGMAVSLFVAVLLCVHTLAWVLWLPFLLLGAAVLSGRGVRGALEGAGYVLAGVLVAAPFAAPPVLELSWIDASRQLVDLERFSSWAIPFRSLFSNRPEGGLSARLVPGPFLLAVVTLGLLRQVLRHFGRGSRSAEERWEGAFLLFALAAFALSTSVGAVCARAFPALSAIQFPWRFLGPGSLFAAAVGGALCGRLRWPFGIAAGAGALLVSWGLLLPGYGSAAGASGFWESARAIRASVYSGDFENRYLPLGARLPRAAVEEALVLPPGVHCEELWEGRGEVRARMTAEVPSRVVVRRYWFPGVRAEVDGRGVAAERDPLDGEVALELPAGAHELRVRRGARALDALYALVSLSALGALLWHWAAGRRRALAWAPCAAACLATAVVGLASPEGFFPPRALERAMEADALLERRPSGGGWSLVHYEVRSGASDFEHPRRGFASELNLAPGGAIRRGFAVWAARLRLPPGWEAALEHAGSVTLFVGGERVVAPAELEGPGPRRGTRGLLEIPIGAPELGGVRVVVAASRIEEGARARLLVRPRGRGAPWRLVASEWLEPDENRGWEEVFPGRRARAGE